MIKSIKIEGFEACKNVEIKDLHKGLNVFIGVTDTGKSTVVKSSEWVYKNRPQGDSFRNRHLPNKKSVKVTHEFYEGTKITREKSKTKNQYILPDGSILKALRSDVPDEVKQITRMKPINIQSQHPKEQYFMLTESPGQVAKKFNDVAGFSVMDRAMSAINKRVRTNKTAMQLTEADIKEHTQILKELDWTIIASKEAQSILKLSKKIKNAEYEITKLGILIKSFQDVKNKLKKYKRLNGAKKELSLLLKEKKDINLESEKLKTLHQSLQAIRNNGLELQGYNDINTAQKELKQLLKAQGEINFDERIVKSLKNILSRLADNEEEIKEARSDFNSYKKKFNSIISKTTCPVCGHKGGSK